MIEIPASAYKRLNRLSNEDLGELIRALIAHHYGKPIVLSAKTKKLFFTITKEDKAPIEIDASTPFFKWLYEHAGRVQKMDKPLSNKEAETILNTYKKSVIKELFVSMANRPNLLEKYTSAYLTFVKWASNIPNAKKEPTSKIDKGGVPPTKETISLFNSLANGD
jgi:hypothetical protein